MMDDALEDGDGFDEIVRVGARQTSDEEFVEAGGKIARGNKTGPGSPVTGPPIQKLEYCRWSDHLSPYELCDVIRKAQADDRSAKDRFYKCFNKKLRKVAGAAKYGGPPFD